VQIIYRIVSYRIVQKD